MPHPTPLIAAWARSAVVPRGGAFKTLQAHEIAAPVVMDVLHRAGLSAASVDALVVGNALGAGGNPARMLGLHAGLPLSCAAYTLDTQCCAGLDAVAMGAALIMSGQAQVVVAGGVEAWSRSPLRMHRPSNAHAEPIAYERPAFAPTPAQDPDLLLSAARYAAHHRYTRAAQEAYALERHQRALRYQARLSAEIVPILGVAHDAYPRHITAQRVARMPVVAQSDSSDVPQPETFALSAFTISAQADGAAFVVLVSPQAAQHLSCQAHAQWVAHASVGSAPDVPLIAAESAARQALARAGLTDAKTLHAVELHDAFAVQALSFAQGLHLAEGQLNAHGGAVARGHPIGASGAIALVRLLSDLSVDGPAGALGLVAVAGAGGLGASAVVAKR